jgi:tetratricopeptide (TPR) repeat protein
MDALFGVVNIPNVVWIDEAGVIVRPAEPGWPSGEHTIPRGMLRAMPKLGRAPNAPTREGAKPLSLSSLALQDRGAYADALRDWVARGADSQYALRPDEVVARSQPRSADTSRAAAHFELANHLWRAGEPARAIAHFRECHRLQPENWTYKRQAWSLLGNERVGGDVGRFAQGPVEGEEASWPFDSDWMSDVSMLEEGEYYPNTI